MKKILLITLLSMCSLIGAKNFVLKDLIYPRGLTIKDNLLFVNENGECVKVYDLKTKKLLSKFGKTGEGPGEFVKSYGHKIIFLNVFNSQLFVKSMGRLSVFKFNGEYIKDIKLPYGIHKAIPLNQNSYVVRKSEHTQKGTDFLTMITDKDFKKQLEISKKKAPFNFIKKEMDAVPNRTTFDTYGGKLFVSDTKEFEIKIIDGKTKKIKKIKHPYKRKVFSSKDKERIAKASKNDPMKMKIIYPDYYPAIEKIKCDKDYLYVFTYKKDKQKQEILIFDHKGKFIKEVYLKFEQEDEKHIYPYTLHNLKLYQIVEKDEDTWELQITDF